MKIFGGGFREGYQNARFQRLSDVEKIVYLRRSLSKFRRRTNGWLKFAKRIGHKKAAAKFEAKIAEIEKQEVFLNQTEAEINKFQKDVESYVLTLAKTPHQPITSPALNPLSDVPYLPLEKYLTTIH